MGDPGTSLCFSVVVDDGEANTELGTFTACQGLAAEYDVHEYQEGGVNGYVHRLPGRLRHPNLVLTRALDSSSGAVASWFDAQESTGGRTTAVVTAYDPVGEVVARWSFTGVFPVRWTGPTLSATGATVATETLELAHTGFRQEAS
ncbi:phage tail protein [Serinicoccus sediminis]|uniref:phage tail protein n=1 Tax=Serinicoccus sediminis TaxID=2306021 RepID=UPI001021CD66|nr:phage tail protein [Serinicoccus sediminis]